MHTYIHTLHAREIIKRSTIELDLNRGVKPFGPIKRQDKKIGGCHLAFSPLLLYRGEG